MLIERSHLKQKMTIRDRIGSIKAAITGMPNQSLLTMARAFAPLYGEPPRRSSREWLEMYHNTPRLNNPVHQIASDVGCASYGIYNKKDPKKLRIPNHPIENLLKKPTPDKTMTGYTLFYLVQVYLLLPNGESFIIKERDGLGRVKELWICPPSWVWEIPSLSRPYFSIFPQGNMQANVIPVHPDDMIYFKDPDISNPYLRGIGRANALGDDIEVDEQMVKYSKRFFYNGAIPSLVGMAPGADEATINRLEEAWSQKYGGVHNSHKAAFLNFDAKLQMLKETNKDLEFVEARRYIRDESHQFFNIPPELMGILESSNRSTISAAYFLYSKNVLRKKLQFIADVLNLQLVPEFDDNVYLEYDQVVPEDEEFLLKKTTEGLKFGALSVNQWLRTNGFDEIGEKGEVIYVPINMVPVSLKGDVILTNLPTVDPPPEPPPKSQKTLTPEHKNRIWLTFDKAAIKHERSFINALKKYFQSQQDKINASLEKSVKAITDNPDELLNWTEEEKTLLATLKPLWLTSLNEALEVANDTFGFGIGFDVMNPKFLDWVKEFGLDRAKGISDTTKDALKKTLSEGIQDGESIPKLRDRIGLVYGDAKGYRATLIARTETVTTVNAGALDSYKTAKVIQKEWLSQIDNRTRIAHVDLNGEVVDIDKPFSNGLQHPQEPNCRCTLLPVLPESD